MKILISVCTNRGLHPEVARGLVAFDLNSQQEHHDLKLHFPQGPYISLSRNNSMREALRWGADWLFFWDDDTQIKDTNFFNTMKDTAYKYDATIVGLPYRLGTPDEIIYNVADKVNGEYTHYRELPSEPKEVDALGTGAMLINIAWIRKNWPEPPYFQVINNKIDAISEDYFFCEGVKERGGKVILEPRIKTTHWKLVGLTF